MISLARFTTIAVVASIAVAFGIARGASAPTFNGCFSSRIFGKYPRQLKTDHRGYFTPDSALKMAIYNLAEANAVLECSRRPRPIIAEASALSFQIRYGALLVDGGRQSQGLEVMRIALKRLENLAANSPAAEEAQVMGYLTESKLVAKAPQSIALADQP